MLLFTPRLPETTAVALSGAPPRFRKTPLGLRPPYVSGPQLPGLNSEVAPHSSRARLHPQIESHMYLNPDSDPIFIVAGGDVEPMVPPIPSIRSFSMRRQDVRGRNPPKIALEALRLSNQPRGSSRWIQRVGN